MYLDFLKADYSNELESKRKDFIERDKKHLGRIIQDRVTTDIEDIVERWYSLEDIGVIEEEGTFENLLKEAEELYSFGYYVGAISLIGVAAEELCKTISDDSMEKNISQHDRIELLYKKSKVSLSSKELLHSIRKIRNNYIHMNNKRAYQDKSFLIEHAINVISFFKETIKNTLKVSDIDYAEVVDKLIKNQDISFIDFKYRHRNILREENIDLQVEVSNKPKIITSIYKIMELDINTEDYREITLKDLNSHLYIVVDLTVPQVKNIKRLKLEEKNGIVATILSNISSIGQTEEWLILDIHEVYRGEVKV